jgi:hypothetical protein
MAPEIPRGFTGGGIAIGGGTSNMVVRNSVMNNPTFGILVLSLNDFLPMNNRVEENVLDNNGLDLGYAPTGATSAGGNCFARNTFASSLPAEIERVMACDALGGSFSVPVYTSPSAVAGPDYRELPAPGPQPSMPLAAARTEGGAGVLDLTVDLAAIEVPAS